MLSENVSSVISGQRRSRSDCASAQSDQGLRRPQTESLDTIECFNGEQMPGWDFAHVQDYVNLHFFFFFFLCSKAPFFSLDAAHIIKTNLWRWYYITIKFFTSLILYGLLFREIYDRLMVKRTYYNGLRDNGLEFLWDIATFPVLWF